MSIKCKHDKVSMTWPNEEEQITMYFIDEESNLELEPKTVVVLINAGIESDPVIKKDEIDWATVSYPDNIRFFVSGKRISLQDAHDALSNQIVCAINHYIKKIFPDEKK